MVEIGLVTAALVAVAAGMYAYGSVRVRGALAVERVEAARIRENAVKDAVSRTARAYIGAADASEVETAARVSKYREAAVAAELKLHQMEAAAKQTETSFYRATTRMDTMLGDHTWVISGRAAVHAREVQVQWECACGARLFAPETYFREQ